MATATSMGLKAGDTVQIIRGPCVGTVASLVRCDGWCWPWFTLTKASQHGEVGRRIAIPLLHEGEKSFMVIPEGDKGGFILNTGSKPVLPAGQRVDLLYKDGSLMLNVVIGSGVHKAVNTGRLYWSHNWDLYGSHSQIVAYRETTKKATPVVPTIAKESDVSELKVGDRVVLIHVVGCAWYSSNNGQEGVVTSLNRFGPTDTATVKFDNGSEDWGRRTALQLVTPAPAVSQSDTDAALAELQAELVEADNGIRVAAEALNTATSNKEALVARLAQFGFTVIGSEHSVQVKADVAFDQNILKVGAILRCDVVCEEMQGQHTSGKTYRIISVDDNNTSMTLEMESEDGFGIWVDDDFLKCYTVLSL